MKIAFTKYHGTGNDFILIDCTNTPNFTFSSEQISHLCHRRFGIGADGLILIFRHENTDFEMRYYNADGSRSFCGNGSRCAVHFANNLSLIKGNKTTFLAIDGIHKATLLPDDFVSIKMGNVSQVIKLHDEIETYIIDTGSPHYIKFTHRLAEEDIVTFGKQIRYSKKFKEKGINVNLVEVLSNNRLKIKTYERGVEEETYSCGTGATAVSIAFAERYNLNQVDLKIEVKGGVLDVKATRNMHQKELFEDVFLMGPAKEVFRGEIEI